MIKKSKSKKIGIGILCGMTLVSIIALTLFHNELRRLASLKVVDDYPMYQMTYYGDYGFDEFLKVGAESDSDIEEYVVSRLLKGLPIDIHYPCLTQN